MKMLSCTPAERGLGLLECIAALALAGLVLASTARVGETSASLVRRTRMLAQTIDLARNLLEHEIGAPCGPSMECPEEFRCSVTRSPVTAAADRVTATVTRIDGGAVQELRTLAPAPACGA